MSISLAFRGAFHYHAFNKLTIISLLFHQLNPSICLYSFQESLQSIKDTASGKQRPAQGTRYVYVPVLLTTIAFGLSVLALASCQFVLYDDPEEACDVNPCTRTSGIYCYDSSLREKVQNFFIGTIQKFVQVIGTGTAILGGIATLLLFKAIKKPHGKCMFKVLGICSICCVPGQFITLSMLQCDFCWNLSKLQNNCTLGWGGNVSIASACMYVLACIALCKVPQPIEREEKEEEERVENEQVEEAQGEHRGEDEEEAAAAAAAMIRKPVQRRETRKSGKFGKCKTFDCLL